MFATLGSLTPNLNKFLAMGTVLIRIFLFLLIHFTVVYKITTTKHFLTCFSCNKEYVFYSDDGFWNVLAEISVFNVNGCCLFTLTAPNIE